MMKSYSLLALAALCSTCHAATIYECRAYSGATFFSTGICSEHKALGVRLHSVPDGMPFDQQVQLIQDASQTRSTIAARDDSSKLRLGQCAQIDAELLQLEKKYTNWEYVPVSEVNVDQQRERDLKSKRNQLQCHLK